MNIMKSDDFRREMKKGLSGGYLFFGDEDYLKLHSLSAARESVCPEPSFALFNDMKIDPLSLTPASLIDALTPLPMMADKKIVSISGLNFKLMRPEEIEGLCEVFEMLDEYDFNVLIISVPEGGIDEGYLPRTPSKLLTRLCESLKLVQFESPSEIKLISWCQKHFEHNGASASDEVCRAIFKKCGTSMFTLSAEIDKLSFYAVSHGKTQITPEDVELVCCAVIEEEAFALTNALLAGKNAAALEALKAMKFNRVDPLNVISEISKAVYELSVIKAMLAKSKTTAEIVAAMKPMPFKLNEYRTKLIIAGAGSISEQRLSRALELCTEADRIFKTGSGGYEVIEQLLCSL